MFSFTGPRPAAWALAIPATTVASFPPRVRREKRSGSSESIEMFTRESPALASGCASSASPCAFVVSDTSSMPGTAAIAATSETSPRRSNGSPPVRRTRRKPLPAITVTMRTISSWESTSARGSHVCPSAGMQ